MLAVRHSLLLVYLFANAARASSGARHANTGGCELCFFAAKPARIIVALGLESSKLPGKFLLIACLAIIFIDRFCLRSFLGLARTTAKNSFHHLFEWEFIGPSKMLDNLRMQ